MLCLHQFLGIFHLDGGYQKELSILVLGGAKEIVDSATQSVVKNIVIS
jgi:hypothetical protein